MNTLNKKYQTGVSLIEIMIAVTIALFLSLGIITMFNNNKRIYSEQDEMGRLQENARFALELLIKDIRMAGYSGCHDEISNVVNHLNGVDDEDSDETTDPPDNDNLLYFGNAVEGYESSATAQVWEPSDSTDEIGNTVANTDAISVRYLKPTGIKLISPYMTVASATVHATTNNGLESEEVVAITDCSATDIIQITNNNPNTSGSIVHNTGTTGTGPGNAFKELSQTYGPGSEITKFVARRYFIGNGSKGPSLFMKNNFDAAVELIEGVENMQIMFGEDTDATADGIANTYRDADEVSNWDKVVAVRLSLLMRTVDEYGGRPVDNKAYKLLDTDVYTTVSPPNDHRRRRIFNADISIRNRAN
jgi:type IV pilus assembly protein PilW